MIKKSSQQEFMTVIGHACTVKALTQSLCHAELNGRLVTMY